MHIGLIGGIGPAATDYYYRKLIKAYAESNSDLDLTIAHADTPTLLANLEAGRKEAQTTIYRRLTSRLKSAGAECVGVTSIAGHFCIEEFEKISELPVVNILTAVSDEIRIRRYETVGIIGTKTVMETRFYGGISSAKIVVPPTDEFGGRSQSICRNGHSWCCSTTAFRHFRRRLSQHDRNPWCTGHHDGRNRLGSCLRIQRMRHSQ